MHGLGSSNVYFVGAQYGPINEESTVSFVVRITRSSCCLQLIIVCIYMYVYTVE
jgi:hypothetical protein